MSKIEHINIFSYYASHWMTALIIISACLLLGVFVYFTSVDFGKSDKKEKPVIKRNALITGGIFTALLLFLFLGHFYNPTQLKIDDDVTVTKMEVAEDNEYPTFFHFKADGKDIRVQKRSLDKIEKGQTIHVKTIHDADINKFTNTVNRNALEIDKK